MFAVPGWSVSAAGLKTQTAQEKAASNKSKKSKHASGGNAAAVSNSRKRKREEEEKEVKPVKDFKVNKNNLAELWETVIEGKPKPVPSGTAKRKEKKRKEKSKQSTEEVKDETPIPAEDNPDLKSDTKIDSVKPEKKGKDRKKQTKKAPQNGASQQPTTGSKLAESSVPSLPSVPPPPAPASTKLTPLQASMRQKLTSARFRHLNQTLYTSPSAQALELFTENPEMFTEYHEGFRKQVEIWPENPVTGYITDIKERGGRSLPQQNKQFRQHKKGKAPPPAESTNVGSPDLSVPPLPRTHGTCTVADLGCGDAFLAQSLAVDSSRIKLRVLSYDLSSGAKNGLVTRADISSLPLSNGAVDIAIFCLALMGTNWLDFIDEAYRVLKWKGELWVAEIKSRFARVQKPGNGPGSAATTSNKNKRTKSGKPKRPGDDDDVEAQSSHDQSLLAEIDGDGGPASGPASETTDVTAFVEVLQNHGFYLQGEADNSNKMFVKMRFLKATTPTKGKNVVEDGAGAGAGTGPRGKPTGTWQAKDKFKKSKFLDPVNDEDGDDREKEAKVLKPCVYKLR
ncbi:MAG: hypothetical protein M4579_001226 [Chaenotheca gracillima]|nr:MAG: hypothetical protein M4579_001226 [Chaenotheca gracillima]